MTTTSSSPRDQRTAPVPSSPARVPSVMSREPEHRVEWTDPVTGARGYLVVHTLVGGLATGGTRMRAGCTLAEVADLARGMATKTAVFGLPVGGAKGGVDLDPRDPRATGVLERFFTAMHTWLDRHWVT
ncbi:MAG TPA: Glu/Leu/Phe/Val dehydrogenase dimerization domain-containing protein, partial [Actinomycetaceae bacterium]|nr:Glu/Leu/Phe/Val dehydrogenase dimerization domain-containing protein [Actinomycetaceae bacterium]